MSHHWPRRSSDAADQPECAAGRSARPGAPLAPILGALVCFAMMYSLDDLTWYRLFVWLGIGLLIYFGYGRKNSYLRCDTANEPRH